MISAADRYYRLVEATLRDGLAHYAGPVVADDERSFVMAWTLPSVADRLGFECAPRLREASAAGRAVFDDPTARFIDGAGHSRAPYSAIAIRACARTRTPMSSTSVVGTVFAAWARTSLRSEAAQTLVHVAANQQPDGTFLPRTDADSLEPQWYDELAILHALHCYASESGNASIAASVHRAVKYHAAETQPDHASTHPWAIAAFLEEADSVPLADMMLHAAGVQQPRTMDAVSLLLLADAFDCGGRRVKR